MTKSKLLIVVSQEMSTASLRSSIFEKNNYYIFDIIKYAGDYRKRGIFKRILLRVAPWVIGYIVVFKLRHKSFDEIVVDCPQFLNGWALIRLKRKCRRLIGFTTDSIHAPGNNLLRSKKNIALYNVFYTTKQYDKFNNNNVKLIQQSVDIRHVACISYAKRKNVIVYAADYTEQKARCLIQFSNKIYP